MFFFRNRLGTGAFIAIIFGAVKVAFDIVYKVLKLLKLQFLLSVLFVGTILFIVKVLPSNTKVLIIFLVFVVLGVLYTLIGNAQRFRKFFAKFEREKKEAPTPKANSEPESYYQEQPKLEQREEPKKYYSKEKYPKYFAVNQNQNYVMAEYKDRYELYIKKEGKLFRVRTDMKKEIR